MFSPRTLTKLVSAFAALFLCAQLMLIFYPPYVGFDLHADENGKMTISRLDGDTVSSGLNLGDIVTRITSGSGKSVDLTPASYPQTTIEARTHHKTIGDQIRAHNLMYEVLSDAPITLTLDNGKQVSLELSHHRPPGSLDVEVWVCIFLSIICWLLPALIWAWRPLDKDIVYMSLAGFGLGLATISAATFYQIELYFMPPPLFWLVFLLVGIGNFMMVVFAFTAFLYFPQKLPFADQISITTILAVVVYSVVVIFDGWQSGLPLTEQLLYFQYEEVYLIEVVGYLGILGVCTAQWLHSKNKPLARIESLWILFAAGLTPALFFAVYLVPVLLGYEAILTRTWTTALIVFGFFLMTIGISRLRFLQFERHVSSIYQWTLLTLIFLGIDLMLIYLTNLGVMGSTALATAVILLVYFPLRAWLWNRAANQKQLNYQKMFSSATETLVDGSMNLTTDPVVIWRTSLRQLFKPISDTTAEQIKQTGISDRGQSLMIAANRFAPALRLDYADGGARLFEPRDVDLVDSLTQVFIQLFDYKDGFSKGQMEERERIRRDLHDQIGGKLLSMIYGTTDEGSRRMATETMDQLRELLKAIKQEPIAISALVAELRQVCEDACQSTGVSLNWHDNLSGSLIDETRQLPSFHYRYLMSIARELISNSVKHAQASSVNFNFEATTSSINISYADDGSGFDPAHVERGNGLNNIESRLEEMEGSVVWAATDKVLAVICVPISP